MLLATVDSPKKKIRRTEVYHNPLLSRSAVMKASQTLAAAAVIVLLLVIAVPLDARRRKYSPHSKTDEQPVSPTDPQQQQQHRGHASWSQAFQQVLQSIQSQVQALMSLLQSRSGQQHEPHFGGGNTQVVGKTTL